MAEVEPLTGPLRSTELFYSRVTYLTGWGSLNFGPVGQSGEERTWRSLPTLNAINPAARGPTAPERRLPVLAVVAGDVGAVLCVHVDELARSARGAKGRERE